MPIQNKYEDGTPVRRGDVVSYGGRYVVIDPAFSDGFMWLDTIEHLAGFDCKAPIDACRKIVPDEQELERAIIVLNKHQGTGRQQILDANSR